MNRKIKFRAWNIKENKMYYDVEKTYDYMKGNPIVCENNFGELLESKDWIVEQYIGLKDKKGRKIFEGDILEYVGGGMFVVCFAEIEAYCPIDERELFTSAFVGVPLEDYSIDGMNCYCPLGPTDSIAKVIGTIHDMEVK